MIGWVGFYYDTPDHYLVHLPPISLLQRGKKQIEISLQESDHTPPCPTLWFFKWKGSDDHVWKEERGCWQPKTENRRVYIVEQKKYNSDSCSS